MNSRAGSGEYSSTSTGPSRSARVAIAPASASASRMSAAAPAARTPSDSSCVVRSSSFDCVRETRPTASPSPPKRRATASPRLGPAPTMTIDRPSWLGMWPDYGRAGARAGNGRTSAGRGGRGGLKRAPFRADPSFVSGAPPSFGFAVAGRHARATTRRYAGRTLATLIALVLGTAALALVLGLHAPVVVLAELGSIAAMLVIARRILPLIDRWDRGAEGGEAVGAILDALAGSGWRALHDVKTGRGNIDHVLIGAAGLLTVETKSHAGRLRTERLDKRMLRQAYAEAKSIERITGEPVTPLLVFSRAYLVPAVSFRDGVTVLPARMLAGHLARRRARLSPEEVESIRARLAAALGEASGAARWRSPAALVHRCRAPGSRTPRSLPIEPR